MRSWLSLLQSKAAAYREEAASGGQGLSHHAFGPGQQDWLGVKAVTIAFTTFEGERRREQLREWTRQELAETKEPRSIGSAFCFTSLPKTPFDVYHLWLEGCWYTSYEEDQPITLLAGE